MPVFRANHIKLVYAVYAYDSSGGVFRKWITPLNGKAHDLAYFAPLYYNEVTSTEIKVETVKTDGKKVIG